MYVSEGVGTGLHAWTIFYYFFSKLVVIVVENKVALKIICGVIKCNIINIEDNQRRRGAWQYKKKLIFYQWWVNKKIIETMWKQYLLE